MSLLDRIVALPAPLPNPTVPVRLAAAVDAVKTEYSEYGAVKGQPLETLVAKAVAALRQWSWGDLTEGDIALLTKAVVSRDVAVPPELEAFLFAELAVSIRPALLSAACEGYLAGWMPSEGRTAALARIIVGRSSLLPRDWQRRFAAIPDLLDTTSGAQTFGRWLAIQSDPFRAALEKGIAAPHGPGFMVHVHDAWLTAQPPANDEHRARHLFVWILPAGAPVLRGSRAASVVAKLLAPWLRTMPPEALRSNLVKVIVGAYGDPRREAPEFWHDVGPDGRRVMMRWLAGRRMEAFLDVVSRAEAAGEHATQWAPRRRFWMGLYEMGRIDEAWVSYGKDAVAIAHSLARETGDPTWVEFGRTDKSRKDTCLLIMRIGAKAVIEGSHNFRIHVFDAGHPGVPELYAPSYDVDLFLLPVGHPDARVHDAAGHWMNWVRRRVL